MLPAPPGAMCAIHNGMPAYGVCARCGNFMCSDCSVDGAQANCPACREKEATPEFPFDENATFTELFGHLVEQFKRDAAMPVIGTVIFFGITMIGGAVSQLFTQVILSSVSGDLNDPRALREHPMNFVVAFGVAYLLAFLIQTLAQAVALGVFYRMLIDILYGRKGDLALMFRQIKDAPKYMLLHLGVFTFGLVVSLVLMGGAGAIILRHIGFDWSNPSATNMDALFTPVPIATFAITWLLLVIFVVAMLPVSIFALPEIVVSGCTPMEAVRRALRLGEGQRIRMLGYAIVIFLITLLGFAACCVGLLVAYPVMYMLWGALFLSLRKNAGFPKNELG